MIGTGGSNSWEVWWREENGYLSKFGLGQKLQCMLRPAFCLVIGVSDKKRNWYTANELCCQQQLLWQAEVRREAGLELIWGQHLKLRCALKSSFSLAMTSNALLLHYMLPYGWP